jgi:hypothetical protein
MARIGWTLGAAAILIAGCGQPAAKAGSPPSTTPTSQASLPASATASPVSPDLLFAVLESRVKSPSGYPLFNTVAIAGLDGYARAKTTFTPLTPPYVGCVGPLFPPQAQVAAGRVFFIDGTGVVRSLAPDKTIARVATFPIGAQQEASFAVSPDGKKVLGTVLTIPPKPSTDACAAGGPTPFAPGDWSQDVYAADAGGAARRIAHMTWPQSATQNNPAYLALVGWDSIGPIGTEPTSIGTQGGGPSRDGWYGPVVQLDPSTGRVVKQLGGPDCPAEDVGADGTYVCNDTNGLEVFNPTGSKAWSYAKANGDLYVPLLAPNRQRVKAGPRVVGKDGTDVPLASVQNGFYGTGWIDDDTVIGFAEAPGQQNMALVRVSAPTRVIDLGFTGTFVGVVRPGS